MPPAPRPNTKPSTSRQRSSVVLGDANHDDDDIYEVPGNGDDTPPPLPRPQGGMGGVFVQINQGIPLRDANARKLNDPPPKEKTLVDDLADIIFARRDAIQDSDSDSDSDSVWSD